MFRYSGVNLPGFENLEGFGQRNKHNLEALFKTVLMIHPPLQAGYKEGQK